MVPFGLLSSEFFYDIFVHMLCDLSVVSIDSVSMHVIHTLNLFEVEYLGLGLVP